MYFFASTFKNSIEWSVTGTALYYICSIDQYATPLAKYALQFPDILRFFTFAIVYFQHAAVFLLFFPFYNRAVRTVTACLLMLMHFSFAMGSYLGIFSWIAIAALLAFLPSLVWDYAGDTLATRTSKIARAMYAMINPVQRPVHIARASTHKSRVAQYSLASLGVLYIAFIFLWQATDFVSVSRLVPGWSTLEIAANVLRIDQRWNLFAPRPYVNDGWDIVEGHLADGRTVDLFRAGSPISYEKPADVYGLYGSSHLREYTLEFRRGSNAQYRPFYAAYTCAQWNATHTGADRLQSLEALFMLELTPPPGMPQTPIRKQSLITYDCL